ncbi:MAG: hypothetical protein IT304_09965 [Dehalococcoidia bacterium]|nr:hypothetical protein [Dehalococcoidia bacterium]
MALTVTRVQYDGQSQGVFGNLRYVTADVDFDSSALAAGESLTASDFGLTQIVGVIPMGATSAGGLTTVGYNFVYDYTNSKLIATRTDSTDGPEEATPDETDLDAVSVRVLVLGK